MLVVTSLPQHSSCFRGREISGKFTEYVF